jgi:hypothetical protein
MSSRQLRKLQKQKELQDLEARVPDEASESEDEAPAPKPKPSLFSGFAALGNEDDEDINEDEEPESAQEEPEQIEAPKAAAKKSKKKKKKAKKAAAETPKDPSKDAPKNPAQDVDEIDEAIRELNLKAQFSGNATVTPETEAYERICELLRINTYHLKVMNEMRNLFGREAIAAAQSEEQEEEQNRARRRGGARQPGLGQNVDLETFLKGQPGKSLPEVTLRRNPFLSGKETWPRAATDGLTMKQIKDGTVDATCGTVEFGFNHDDGYNKLERQFFGLVQLHDPMQLVYFLQRHPYHISTLIQVSKVAKQDQNSALAGDLCERALFTFGRVSVSAFRQKLEEGKARLEFKRPENRQFWLAGYHYLKSLVMKGTYRTALEWTKVLFGMDLSDPYGVVHFLHPLAIRAHESKWFIDFCDSEALDKCDTAQDYVRQTLVLARLQQKDSAGAKVLLIEGMERLPWLYSSLFKALNTDVPRSIWGQEPRDEHEALFTELYIHQTKQLWDNSQAITLLKEAAALAQKPSFASLPQPPVAGRNVGRFVYLDNTPALMALVPDNMLHGFPNWDFDPLPPAQGDNIFSYESQKLPWNPDRGAQGGEVGDLGMDNMAGRGALQHMLEQARLHGAPPELRQALEAAIGHLGPEDGEDQAEQDAPQGLWQAFMDMIMPARMVDEEEDGGMEFDYNDLPPPGAWPSDSEDSDMPTIIREELEDETDDEMPRLVPGNLPRGRRDLDEDTDDEMPPLQPIP